MIPADPAQEKFRLAPFDYRLAVTFSSAHLRPTLTALLALDREIREIPAECRDPGVAGAKLMWWEQEIDLLHSGRPRHPLSIALAAQAGPLDGTRPLFMDLIAGTRMDLTGPALPEFEDVKRYCYRRSGALAELGARLAGVHDDRSLLAARLLGDSVRLGDIVTGGVALALRGRVYFATTDLHLHGIDQHITGEDHSHAGVRALLEDYAGRARSMHSEALAMLGAVDRARLTAWCILAALAMKRMDLLAKRDFSPPQEPLESHPLTSLFTAWRTARVAG